MERIVSWMGHKDQSMLLFFNRTIRCRWLDRSMPLLTHIGGATFSVGLFAILWLIGVGGIGIEGLISLTSSHLLVQVMKRGFVRPRPYLVYEQLLTAKNPLQDFSFPSGHTTAVFSTFVTIVLHHSYLFPILFPIACMVALSRVYLGLHYPTDVLIGAMIGILFSLAIHILYV